MPSLTNWLIFFHDRATPADAQAIRRPPAGSITLLTGETVQGIPFQFEQGIIALDTLRPGMPDCPNEGYAIAVATIHSETAQTVNFGVSTDWWLEVYVNGEMAGSTQELGNGTASYTPLSHIFPLSLKAGENTLAVWLHHGPWVVYWPFCAALLPSPPEALNPLASLEQYRQLFFHGHERIAAGPFLKAAEGHLQIQVELFFQQTAILLLRPQGADRWQEFRKCVLGQLPMDTHYAFDLPSLTPDTTYEYCLKTADTSLEHEETTPVYVFHTPPQGLTTHRFFCTADLQMSRAARQRILEGFFDHDAAKADLFCTLGDLLNSTDEFYQEYFLDVLAFALDRTDHRQVWVPVRGNHELRGPHSSDWFKYLGCSYYLFRYADTAYLVLDSGDDKRVTPPPHIYTRRTDHTELFNAQREWLLQAIATPEFQTAKHRIILCHATPFDQDADFEEFHEQFMARNLQRLLGDFFYGPNPRYKIDLWLAGHTHKSARYTPHDQKIVSFSAPGFHRLTEREKDLYPFPVVVLDGPGNIGPCQASGILVTVTPEFIEVLSRQPTGEVIDHIRIQPDNTVEVIETALQ